MAEEPEQITLDVNIVLEITEQRLAKANKENILLECLVNQQREEINKLQAALEKEK